MRLGRVREGPEKERKSYLKLVYTNQELEVQLSDDKKTVITKQKKSTQTFLRMTGHSKISFLVQSALVWNSRSEAFAV